MIRLLPRLLRDSAGATAIEFALLGPALITMLFGMLQIGIGMQAYSAIRGVSADVGRHVSVEYQKSNELSKRQIELLAEAMAVQAPYLLSGDLEVDVTDAPLQRVAGAKEMRFSITYTVPSVLDILGIGEFDIAYTRPIFVSAAS